MPWPSTKATTTHLDNQADDPNQARPEIKQNIENVNDIIDFFPSGGLPIGNSIVVLEMTGTGGSSASDFNDITEHSDTGGLCAITSNDRFTLASGTYIMEHETIFFSVDTTVIKFENVTAGTTVVTSNPIEVGTTNQSAQMGLNNTVFTSNGSDLFAFGYLQYTASNGNNARDGLRIKFTKIA